jgi:hypothetical protein
MSTRRPKKGRSVVVMTGWSHPAFKLRQNGGDLILELEAALR